MTTTSLMSVTEVAEELGVERARVFRLIKRKRIPVQRAGWSYLIELDTLPLIREKLGIESDSE